MLLVFIALLSSVPGNSQNVVEYAPNQPINITIEVGEQFKLKCTIPSQIVLTRIRWYLTVPIPEKLVSYHHYIHGYYIGGVSYGVSASGNISIDLRNRTKIEGETNESATLIIDNETMPTYSGSYICLGYRPEEIELCVFDVTVIAANHSKVWNITTSTTNRTSPNTNTTLTTRAIRHIAHTTECRLGTSALVGIVFGVAVGAVIVTLIVVIVLGRMGRTPRWCRKQDKSTTRSTRKGPFKRDERKTNNPYEDIDLGLHGVYCDIENVLCEEVDTQYCDINDIKIDTDNDTTTTPTPEKQVESYDGLAFTSDHYIDHNSIICMTSLKIAAESAASSSVPVKDSIETPEYSVARKAVVPKDVCFVLDENDKQDSNGLTATAPSESQPIECQDYTEETTSTKMAADSGASYSHVQGNCDEANTYSSTYPVVSKAEESSAVETCIVPGESTMYSKTIDLDNSNDISTATSEDNGM